MFIPVNFSQGDTVNEIKMPADQIAGCPSIAPRRPGIQ
jgi:hypothetical protein